MKNPALIFDFGNVVAFFDYTRSCERLVAELRLATSGAALMDELRARGLAPLVALYERGAVDDDRFIIELTRLLQIEADPTLVRQAWADVFWLNAPIAALVAELDDRGYTLVLGSNTNAIHATGFLAKFAETFRHFDAFVLSYQVGCSKPAPEFYRECARHAARAPRDCVFIDDLPENVHGAQAAGLDAIHFLDADQLRASLRERGVQI